MEGNVSALTDSSKHFHIRCKALGKHM